MFIPMIDTLIYSNDIENYDAVMRCLLDKLEAKKQAAKIALTMNDNSKVIMQIGEMEFEVLANGKKGYAYILHNGFYEIDLAQFRSKNESFNPIFIKIKSECLWSLGYLEAFKQIQDWQYENFGNVVNNKITRIDLCFHTDDISLTEADIDNFKGLFYTDCMYRYRRRVTSVNFGSSATGKLYARIYDKVLEIEQKRQKTWFFQVWKERGLNPKKVWNIEFQVLRDFMVEQNISDVYQAFESLSAIWHYCTEKWLVKIIRNNDNISRCSIASEWQALQTAFDYIKPRPLIKREKQMKADAVAMVPSTYGYFTSYAAKVGMLDMIMVIESLTKAGEQYLETKGKSFKRVVSKKRALLETKYGNNEELDVQMNELCEVSNEENTII